jgi:hypothetical protein
MKRFYILVIMIFAFIHCSNSQDRAVNNKPLATAFTKMEMHLSAYGVESDNFPSIDISIDFVNNSSSCRKWFYNPAFKDSVYSFSKNVTDNILQILRRTDWGKIKKEYTTQASDQPASTITIYTEANKFTIKDYGLKGDAPLQELYKIGYKL